MAVKGVWDDVGKITGTPSTVSEAPGAPSSTAVRPEAGMDCEPPAASVPVHSVVPPGSEVASTQHGCDAATVTVNGETITE